MQTTRYNSVAISLHWLIALLLIGLVMLGQVMSRYPDDDPFRFELIQWHKSFGILALVMVVIRLLWRVTHRPPQLPDSMRSIEKLGSGGAHLVLYLLMFLIPLSGWVMVSASPLNLQTELFGLIPWPHLPIVSELPDKADVAEQFVGIHHLLVKALVVIVVLHVLAALRHYLFLKDGVMSRMFLSASHGRDNSHGIVPGVLIALAGSVFLVNKMQQPAVPVAIGSAGVSASSTVDDLAVSNVGFTVMQMGEAVNGIFADREIILLLDAENPAASSLTAMVKTASVNTGDGQTDATVVTADWFASEEYPVATFVSQQIEVSGDDAYAVSGVLTIRAVSQTVSFLMSVVGDNADGSLTIDRTAFGVGNNGQDEFIDPQVTIQFEATVSKP